MGGGSGGRGTVGSRGPPRGEPRTAASTWFAVAVIGVLVFVVGVWKPAWSGVANGVAISYVFAILGGILCVVGLTYGYDALPPRARRSNIEGLPGVEVFRPDPPAQPGGPAGGAPPDRAEERTMTEGGAP